MEKTMKVWIALHVPSRDFEAYTNEPNEEDLYQSFGDDVEMGDFEVTEIEEVVTNDYHSA
jgi:hypothetical protein